MFSKSKCLEAFKMKLLEAYGSFHFRVWFAASGVLPQLRSYFSQLVVSLIPGFGIAGGAYALYKNSGSFLANRGCAVFPDLFTGKRKDLQDPGHQVKSRKLFSKVSKIYQLDTHGSETWKLWLSRSAQSPAVHLVGPLSNGSASHTHSSDLKCWKRCCEKCVSGKRSQPPKVSSGYINIQYAIYRCMITVIWVAVGLSSCVQELYRSVLFTCL